MGRPWEHLITPELEAEAGAYVDYAAFEKWLAGVGDGLIRQTMEDAPHGQGVAELTALYVAVAAHADRLTEAYCRAKVGECRCGGSGLVARRSYDAASGEMELDGFDDCPGCAAARRELKAIGVAE